MLRRGRAPRIIALCLGVTLLVFACALSLFVGAGRLSPDDVVAGIRGTANTEVLTIVREMRMGRTLAALLVGLALGVAGHTMQALIANPLADPGLLGVNAGAGIAVVVAVGVFGVTSFAGFVWFALAGALLVSLGVYALTATIGRASPFTVVLGGVAVTAVLTGVTTALALIDPGRFNALRTWMAGSVSGRTGDALVIGGGIVALGLVVAALTAPPLAQLTLGDDTARALGVRLRQTKFGATVAIMLLAGAATALGGPIVFVGLITPHLARAIAGHRVAWGFALSGVAGALIVVVADIIGRVAVPPGEVPAGVLTAIIGAPVLAFIARGRGGSGPATPPGVTR